MNTCRRSFLQVSWFFRRHIFHVNKTVEFYLFYTLNSGKSNLFVSLGKILIRQSFRGMLLV